MIVSRVGETSESLSIYVEVRCHRAKSFGMLGSRGCRCVICNVALGGEGGRCVAGGFLMGF